MLKAAINRSVAFYTKPANEILREVVASDKVTPSELVGVINASDLEKSTVIKAINSPKADASVLDAASRSAKKFYSKDASEILNVIDARRKTLAKQVQVNKPQPIYPDDMYDIDRILGRNSSNETSSNYSSDIPKNVINDFINNQRQISPINTIKNLINTMNVQWKALLLNVTNLKLY